MNMNMNMLPFDFLFILFHFIVAPPLMNNLF